MATYQVEVEIRPWEDGGYIAEAVGLQGCWVTADTIDQAVDDIREVIQMWIRVRKRYGWELPVALKDADESVGIRVVLPVAVA
jgi:predicted RNase H-like HicB family nuclease